MLSAVLRSDIAIQVSIRIMKTFVELRRYLAHGALLLERVSELEIKQLESDYKRIEFEQKTEKKLDEIFDYIASHEESNQKIFYDGQIFDAYSLLNDIICKADNSIVLIDGYVDLATLKHRNPLLAQKKINVDICIYTLPNTLLTKQDIVNFNAQYPSLKVRRTSAFHDRFLIIDNNYGYHIGASLKDAGKKCFGIK